MFFLTITISTFQSVHITDSLHYRFMEVYKAAFMKCLLSYTYKQHVCFKIVGTKLDKVTLFLIVSILVLKCYMYEDEFKICVRFTTNNQKLLVIN